MTHETVGRPMEILLIEDTLTFARLTIGSLRNASFKHRLTWVRDGEDALNFLNRVGRYIHAPQPDLILLDLGLPGIDGREVLRHIRTNDDLAELPVVLLTAEAQENVKFSGELTVEGYLRKPVDMGDFLALIRTLNRYWHEDMILPSESSDDTNRL